MPHSIASSLTLPSVTNDHRERLLSEQPLLSLYELFLIRALGTDDAIRWPICLPA